MSTTPVITWNGNQRTISYDISEESRAAKAKAEAELLAGGVDVITADSLSNDAGLRASNAALATVYAQENARPSATSDDNPNAGSTNNVSSNAADNSQNWDGSNQGGLSVDISGVGQNAPPYPRPSPGARKSNPLSNYSSSTYSISLYMVTSEYYNNYAIANPPGTLPNMTDQIYVVAQSAGVNNSFDNRLITLNGQLGRGQPGLDYYIEDLSLTTLLPGAQKASVASEIKFKIVEPNGFAFMQKLKVASTLIDSRSPLAKKTTSKPTPMSQTFILGIRFYGYDQNGNIVNSGGPPNSIVQNSVSTSVSERFIAIKISSIKFKLNAESTVYSCEAFQLAEQVGYSKVNAIVKSSADINGSTVGEVLGGTTTASSTSRSLIDYMNKFNVDQTGKNITDPTTYKIEFMGAAATKIANATLVDDNEVNIKTTNMQPITTTDKATVKQSFKSTSYNPTTKSVSIPAGTSLLQAIDNIIVKSSFVTDAASIINNSDPESKSTKKSGTTELQWYSINPLIRIKNRDPRTDDWVYDITYQIGLYDISYLRSEYLARRKPFPGPYKVYNYLLTGLNSEILDYEMAYDNLYYVPVSASASGSVKSVGGKQYNTDVPKGVQNSSNSDPQSGKQNKGSEINDSIRASVYSVADNAEAKIKIIGDPDWIMTTLGTDQKTMQTEATTNYFGADFSINPLAGQVYLQIIFNIAEDYLNTGLMDVSDNIQFYNSDAINKNGIKGMIYKVWQVESTFMKGQFVQVLSCIIVNASQIMPPTPSETDSSNQWSNNSGQPDPKVADSTSSTSTTNNARISSSTTETTQSSQPDINASGVSAQSASLSNNTVVPTTARYADDDTVLTSTQTTSSIFNNRNEIAIGTVIPNVGVGASTSVSRFPSAGGTSTIFK